MLDSGTEIESTVKGNVYTLMDLSIRVILKWIRLTVTGDTLGQSNRGLYLQIHMKVTGKREKWMVVENLYMRMDRS